MRAGSPAVVRGRVARAIAPFACAFVAACGSGGGGGEPRSPASDGAFDVDLGGIRRGEGTAGAVANFRFSVGEAYRRSSAAPPSDTACLESFFGGALAPLQTLPGLLPTPVSVVYDDCGQANAFHDAATSTITPCSELARHARDRFRANAVGGRPTQALTDAFVGSSMAFVLYHEIGHALDYQRDLPIVGSIESAVDSIATVIAVETNGPLHALAGAELFFDTPPSLAGRHGGGVDRAGDIYRWTIGGDPPTRDVAATEPDGFSAPVESSGRDCVGEYADLRAVVRGWIPDLARLQGVPNAPVAEGGGPFTLRLGQAWLAAEGANPASRDKPGEAAAWLVHHEAGHAPYESGVIPATLDVETAADAFATVLVVESRRGLAAAAAAAREA